MENEAKVVEVENKEEFKDAVEEHVKSETEEERRRRILTKLIEENKQGAAAKIKRANESQEAREIFPGKLDTSDRLFNKTHIPIDLSCGDNAYVVLENDLNIGGVTVPKLLTLSQMRQMNKAMSLGSVWPNVYIDGGYGGRSRSNVSMFFLRSLVVEGGNVFISLRGIGYFARSLCKMNGASYSDAIKFIIMHYLTTPCIAESFMYLRTYTFEEQISLIKLAHEQFIAYAYFRNFSQILTEKTKETIVSFRERLRGGWYWFWDQVGPYKNSIFILLTSLLAVSAVSSFASMLKPASTSRTYFGRAVRTRGVVPTNNTLDILTSIRHKVKDCLQEVEFRRCDDNVVYGRASVNVQRIDRYLIVPAHVFHSLGKQKDTYLMCSLRPTYNSMDLWEYIILDSHIMFVENKDIAILYVPQMPPAPDLSNMLMTKQEWATHEMPSTMHSFYRLGNELVTQDLTDLQILHEPICYNTGEEYNGPYLQLHGHIEKGASGSPVLAKIPKGRCVFAGFLSGKNKMGTVWATVLTREEYSDTIKKFRNFKPVFHEGACAVTEFTPTSLNGHCSQYITEHVQVVGLVPKGRILGQVDKTSYIKTPISTKFSSERKPAILSYRDPACIDQHPLQHSVNKTGRGTMKDMHPKYYVKASAWLSDWITGIATARHRTIDVEYNYEFIIRGTNGAKPIDVSTSPGIPYVWDRYAGKPPGKRAYIDYNEEGHITTLDPTMLNNCKSIDSMIRRGVLPPLMNYEFPKDELRPIGKSTRSVTVMPLEVTMLYRKYNMGLDSFLHSLSDGSFPICVGMDIHSRAWTMIYNNLLKNSPTACDMDVSGWDGHWPYWLHDATSWVTEDIYEFFHRNHSCDDCFGNPEGVYCDVYREERWARKSISEYNLYGPSQFGDIILQKWRGMSSGYPGTADKNSMSHLLLILTLYILHCERCNRLDMKRLQIFRENVVCFVYGDDILISIKDSFKPFFSYENLISLYEEFGWPCTSSSKQGKITEKPVNLCVFLKHQFILDINFGKAWVHAALDEQVITDLCYWIRKTTKPRTQLYENLDTALEYKYSHGKEKFNMLRTRILLACREKNILMILPEFDYYHEVLIKRHFDV